MATIFSPVVVFADHSDVHSISQLQTQLASIQVAFDTLLAAAATPAQPQSGSGAAATPAVPAKKAIPIPSATSTTPATPAQPATPAKPAIPAEKALPATPKESTPSPAMELCTTCPPPPVVKNPAEHQAAVEKIQQQLNSLQAKLIELKNNPQQQTSRPPTPTPVSTQTIEHTTQKQERNLGRGVSGNDVQQLQEFLRKFPNLYPEGLATGYFGHLTEKAIQRLQEKLDIVSSGDPATTGFGKLGPKTKARIEELTSAINRKHAPKISAIGPQAIPLGGTIVISGSGFALVNNSLIVKGKTVLSGIASVDGKELIATLPLDLPCAIDRACPIKVMNANGVSNAKPIKLVDVVVVPVESPPGVPQPETITGCTDADATNFNSQATKDDGECLYPEPEPIPVPPTPVLTILSPNGGEEFVYGNSVIISWDAAFVADKLVNLNLLKAGTVVRSIKANITLATESGAYLHAWIVPSDIPAGNDYTVEIVGAVNGAVHDTSDAPFVIKAPAPVIAPLTVLNESLPAAAWGVPYYLTSSIDKVTLKASGGIKPYTWTVISGALPGSSISGVPGMTIATTSGYIYGWSTQARVHNFTLQVTDSRGVSAQKDFSIEVKSLFAAGWAATSLPTNHYARALTVPYERASFPNATSLRLYEKKPGETTFVVTATFPGIRDVSCAVNSSMGTSAGRSNGWSLSLQCGDHARWYLYYGNYPSSLLSIGEYQMYIAAVDDAGGEVTVSPIMKQYNLAQTIISSPKESQSPVLSPPTFQWTSAQGFPVGINPAYVVTVSSEYDSVVGGVTTKALSAPYMKTVRLLPTDTLGSQIYDGPALDPSKIYVTRIHSSMAAPDYTLFTSSGYISMVASTTKFWVNQ